MSRLSIIIPVRDRRGLLEELLRQLVGQARVAAASVEIIVVDDASGTTMVGDDLIASGVVVERIECHSGAQVARQRGLSLATGDIVHFHDSDDLVDDDWLSKVLEAFANDAELDLLITSRVRVHGDGSSVLVKPHVAARLCTYPARFLHYQRFRNAIGPLGGVTFRRRVLRSEDFLDFPASQDWLLYDAVLARGPKAIVRHDIRFICRLAGSDRIGASPLRRIKGFVLASRVRFSKPWAQRAALRLYCAQAGDDVARVVSVPYRSVWTKVGEYVARSRIMAMSLSRHLRGPTARFMPFWRMGRRTGQHDAAKRLEGCRRMQPGSSNIARDRV